MRRILIAALLSFLGCADDSITSGGDAIVVVDGHFAAGFETSTLKPCAGDESWCLSGPDSFFAEYESTIGLAPGESQRVAAGDAVYVRLRGRRSERGSYCHLGAYERKFEVLEVLEIRPIAASDCD